VVDIITGGHGAMRDLVDGSIDQLRDTATALREPHAVPVLVLGETPYVAGSRVSSVLFHPVYRGSAELMAVDVAMVDGRVATRYRGGRLTTTALTKGSSGDRLEASHGGSFTMAHARAVPAAPGLSVASIIQREVT
jgi:hypothetical protein